MDLNNILQLIPDYQDFLTLDELHESSRRLVDEFPAVCTTASDW